MWLAGVRVAMVVAHGDGREAAGDPVLSLCCLFLITFAGGGAAPSKDYLHKG